MEAVTPAVCELAVASSPTDWRYVVCPSRCVFFRASRHVFHLHVPHVHTRQRTRLPRRAHSPDLTLTHTCIPPRRYPRYVAEGAYNVVARYQGPHATLQGLVLRCAKRGARPHDPPVAHAAAAEFAQVVMTPLLGRRYVLPSGGGVAIRPREGFVNALDAHVRRVPTSRSNASVAPPQASAAPLGVS